MTDIKPIETVYRGYRFRSRLEARWAVFFDALNIPFEYEKEGFDLGAGEYLPDFWLPKQQCWVEIKGESPTEDEDAKAHELAATTGHHVYVFFGAIPEGNGHFGSDSAYKYFADGIGGWDNHHRWCQCWACGALGIQFGGESDRLRCCAGYSPYTTDDTKALVDAYAAARGARFEHGESPRIAPPVWESPIWKPSDALDIARATLAELRDTERAHDR